MFEEQKKLLADLKAAERAGLKILAAGVKISGVVQKLRGAVNELEARVRHLEREEKLKPASRAPAAKSA